MLDPTTEQIRLFLRANRPKSAFAIAIIRALPWRSTAIVLAAAVTAYAKL